MKPLGQTESNTSQTLALMSILNNIKEWNAYILSKWKLIIVAMLIGSLIGYLKAKETKIYYKATMTFILDDEKPSSSGGLGSLASQLGIDVGSGNDGMFTGSNIMGLMKSRFIIEKALLNPFYINGDTISYAEYYIKLNNLRKKWGEDPKYKNIYFAPNTNRSSFTLEQDIILKSIYIALTSPDRLFIGANQQRSPFSIIEVSNEDEIFAKSFCENLLKVTYEFYIETKSGKSKKNIAILEKQIDSIRSEYNFSLVSVASASDEIYNLNPAFKSKGTLPAKRQIDLQINSTMLSSLISNLEMSKMTLRKEMPLFQVIDKPILPLEKTDNSITKSIIVAGTLAFSMIIIIFISYRLLHNLLVKHGFIMKELI